VIRGTEISGNPPRLVFSKPLGRRVPARLNLEKSGQHPLRTGLSLAGRG
jgi:hypothetical protein